MHKAIQNKDSLRAIALLEYNVFIPANLDAILFGAVQNHLDDLATEVVSKGAKYDENVMLEAIKCDNQVALKNCIDMGIEITCWALFDLAYNNLQWAIEFLIENEVPKRDDWSVMICAGAASGGHLELLKWAYSRGFELGHAMGSASIAGHVNCLRFLRSVTPEWPVDLYTYNTKAEIRRYLHDAEYPSEHVNHGFGWVCQRNPALCEYCNEKKEAFANLWYMDSVIYDNFIQWLPKEMAEDVFSLVSVRNFS